MKRPKVRHYRAYDMSYGSTGYDARTKDNRIIHGNVNCCANFQAAHVIPNLHGKTVHIGVNHLEELKLHRGEKYTCHLNRAEAIDYKRLLGESCLAPYIAKSRFKFCSVFKPPMNHATLILVHGLFRLTWDRAGSRNTYSIVKSILRFYHEGYTADQSLVLGSLFEYQTGEYRVSPLGGHAPITTSWPYQNIANLLPQVLAQAEQNNCGKTGGYPAAPLLSRTAMNVVRGLYKAPAIMQTVGSHSYQLWSFAQGSQYFLKRALNHGAAALDARKERDETLFQLALLPGEPKDG